MTTEGPIQVAASADDAEENDGGSAFNSTQSRIRFSPGTTSQNTVRYNGGFKFDSVDIAGTATIDAVDMEVFMVFSGDRIRCFIRANDVDDAADFSGDADVTTRVNSAATSAAATWTVVPAPSGFRQSNTDDGVDANAVIQEVIDRGGWSSGNNMVILLEGREEAWYYCEARAYDGNTAQAAKLTIDYTVGGGGPAVLASRRLLSGTGR